MFVLFSPKLFRLQLCPNRCKERMERYNCHTFLAFYPFDSAISIYMTQGSNNVGLQIDTENTKENNHTEEKNMH